MISPRTARRAILVSWGFTLALLLGGLTLTVMNRSTMDINTASLYGVFAVAAVSFSSVGGLIARRNASNPIGWLFCLMALALAALPFSQEYAIRGRFLSPGSLPAADFFGFASDWLFFVILVPMALVFLLFPEGRPLSPRWRIAVWAAGISGSVFLVTDMLSRSTANGTGGDRLTNHGGAVSNPIGILSSNEAAGAVIGLTLFVATIAGVVSLILRLRRARGVERQQVRWLAYTGAAAVVLIPVLPLSVALNSNLLGNLFWFGITSVLALGIPIASGIAILKYRLYDLDVVVKKTVVFGVLAAFATLVYLAVVVGIGAAIGSRGNGTLTLAAAAIVAIAFQPLRTRARHVADRLVYGKRATPYEVLSEFSDRMAVGFSTEDVLPRMAQILGQGTGAEQARVWLRVGPHLRQVAAWPQDGHDGATAASVDVGDLDLLPGAGRTFPVRHQGALLGALTVTMPASEPLTPLQERLIGDLASQAGLVLRNVRLIEELRASRQRLVSAQDEERRKIERNIHDGAQQQLVALSVQAKLLQQLIDRDAEKAKELAASFQVAATDALEDLRDLARGIYPPLLADRGLAAALEAQARKASFPVEVDVDGIERYAQDAEAAIYFCVLEALQNVAKYAKADRVTVRLAENDDSLSFTVTDDGAGFDPAATGYGTGMQGMADRMDAIGGTLHVQSQPGEGTTVTGRIPAQSVESVS